jgi:hypothetical protein
MLGNWIRASSTTGGTGNLTLVAASGFPSPGDVFATNQLFAYSILDANSRPLEAGWAYMNSTPQMVRARATATYSGGTYNAANPTALNLSGTVTVVCTPTAQSEIPTLTTVDSVSGSIQRCITAANRACPGAAANTVALRCYYVPFELRAGIVVKSLGIFVATPQAATTAKAGIYACTAAGYPGALLCVTPTAFDCSGAAGMRTVDLTSQTFLPPGWYFTAMACTGTPTVTCYSSTQAAIAGGNSFGFTAAGAVIDYRYETLGSLTMPTAANTTTSSGGIAIAHVPAVYVYPV